MMQKKIPNASHEEAAGGWITCTELNNEACEYVRNETG